MRRKPGYMWRTLAHGDDGQRYEQKVQADDKVCFDELVIDSWFHLEQMDDRDWWISIGDQGTEEVYHVNVHIYSDNRPPRVSIEKNP